MAFESTFKALSDPSRRRILELLRRGPKNAGELAAQFGTTNATISHHLSVLKDAGLISDEKKGKYIYYELNTSVVEDLMAWVAGLIQPGPNDDAAGTGAPSGGGPAGHSNKESEALP